MFGLDGLRGLFQPVILRFYGGSSSLRNMPLSHETKTGSRDNHNDEIWSLRRGCCLV